MSSQRSSRNSPATTTDTATLSGISTKTVTSTASSNVVADDNRSRVSGQTSNTATAEEEVKAPLWQRPEWQQTRGYRMPIPKQPSNYDGSSSAADLLAMLDQEFVIRSLHDHRLVLAVNVPLGTYLEAPIDTGTASGRRTSSSSTLSWSSFSIILVRFDPTFRDLRQLWRRSAEGHIISVLSPFYQREYDDAVFANDSDGEDDDDLNLEPRMTTPNRQLASLWCLTEGSRRAENVFSGKMLELQKLALGLCEEVARHEI